MRNFLSIDPIEVKDKDDVIKALIILERIGIKQMTDEQKANYLADKDKVINNYFMIQGDDGSFRIQSHYIGFGVSVESLEKQVNEIIKRHPDICERLIDVETKRDELIKEFDKNIRELSEERNVINVKISKNYIYKNDEK